MLTLYHCADARSFRPLWTLEELGLTYQLNMLPFPPRLLAKDYLGVNPLGTIPTLLDDGARMTESAAMIQYLAARYGEGRLDVPVQDARYAAYLNWLHFGEATLTFPQTLVLRYTRLEPEDRRQPQVAGDYRRWFLARLRGVEAALADERPYLCGEAFTGADISVGYALLLAQTLGIEEAFTGPVRVYWDRLTAREAYRRARRVQAQAANDQGVAAAQVTSALKP
ncbi:glutathione S-transferase family protein [Phenylobacterium montanum]|uniref:Glutathione S-transferase family protein n=1 Tax=Phenylobacterium montanum TaxID=2823693 RepID=A0A975IUL7_9CAUL|nr:glutathione S-transferase family protein [Caulobacter sp. S6]QUD87659.1 glutathione S-transferase family protein [Caulobacter sp. S6]